jgi:branched-chain amino acid transport system substrate-binding protein
MEMINAPKRAALAALVATAALMWDLPSRAEDDTIKIGFAIAQSLWMSAYDVPPFIGAQLAIEDINARGGVLGKKLRWVTADTKSDPAEGAKAAQSVISQGANFVVVSCDYDMGGPAATVADSHRIVVMATCAGDAKMGVQGIGPYAFTMATSAVAEGAMLAKWAKDKQNWRSAYILLDTTVQWTKSSCAGFKDQWIKAGGRLVGEDTFKQDDLSIASQVTRLQQATASGGKLDMIFLCSYGRGAVSAIKQLRSTGVAAPIVAGDSMDGDYWTKAIPDLNDFYVGAYGSVFGDDSRPRYNDFMKRSADHNNGERPVTSQAVTGYSVIEALALGMERAKSTNSDAVLAEMNKFKAEDFLVGPTTFTPDLHIQVTRPTAIMEITNGKGHYVGLIGLDEAPSMELLFSKK